MNFIKQATFAVLLSALVAGNANAMWSRITNTFSKQNFSTLAFNVNNTCTRKFADLNAVLRAGLQATKADVASKKASWQKTFSNLPTMSKWQNFDFGQKMTDVKNTVLDKTTNFTQEAKAKKDAFENVLKNNTSYVGEKTKKAKMKFFAKFGLDQQGFKKVTEASLLSNNISSYKPIKEDTNTRFFNKELSKEEFAKNFKEIKAEKIRLEKKLFTVQTNFIKTVDKKYLEKVELYEAGLRKLSGQCEEQLGIPFTGIKKGVHAGTIYEKIQ